MLGQIGEAGQQDKLTYVSLTHHIDLGLTKGYKESEVSEAVIKAISPPHYPKKLCVDLTRPFTGEVAQNSSCVLSRKSVS